MNTVDKTPEQLKEMIRNIPLTIERQLLPEPDFHMIALEQAGKLDNKNLDELLGRAEEIEKWLREPEMKLWKRRYPITHDMASNVRESNP